jgi:nuclear pore complex protein Nup98-Nup96
MFGSSTFGNNAQSSFGNTNNGFGSSTFGNTGFGNNQQNNTMSFGGGAFGNNQNSAFGSSNNAFGNKSFGQSNSMFGNNNQSSFGFGSNNNNTSTFGTNNTFGTKSFGMGNGSTFGGNTGGFGSQNNTGFGFNSSMTQNQGTGNPPYSVHSEKEPNMTQMSNFHSITAMPQYTNFSFEELRLKDYQMNKKFPQGGFSNTNTFGSSSFGMNSNNQAFGQKSAFGNTTSSFGQNNMNSFGSSNNGFGSNNNAFGTNNNAFGSNNNTGTSLFGSNQNNAFGQMNNNSAFGSSLKSTNSGFGFGNNTGFGSNNNATSAFGNNNNNSTGFSFGTQNNNTGAFGNTNNAFGMKSTNNTGTSGFGFGSNQNNNSLSINKPTNSTGLFSSFGNNNNNSSTSLFGNTQNNNSTSLFGNNNTNTGGLFGNKSTLGGGFNINKPATSTLNTTNKPLFSFSNTGTNNTGFGNQSTSLFQNKPITTGFSSLNTAKPVTGSLFGSTNTTLGGMNTGLNQAPLQAAIDQAPYGINPLFESSTTSSTLGASTTEVSDSSKIKKSISSSQYKTTPKDTTKIKLQGFSAPSPGLKPELSRKALFGGKSIDDPLLTNKLVTRKSIKKLIITKDDDKNGNIKFNSSSSIQKENKKINFNDNLEISASNSKQKLAVTPFTVNKNTTNIIKPGIFLTLNGKLSNETKVITKDEAEETKSSYINDYIISPSLSEMNRMSNDELRHIKNLIVTYPGVGSVHFLEPVDLISASPTHDRNGIVKIFGSVIIIEPKVCTVYPGEENKPPVGQGLNVPAHIELLKCWTMDKTTQKPIVDVEHPRFKRHMKKLKTMPDTEFISFDIETGCWSFNVEHFSRYGLFNEEEEEEAEVEKNDTKFCKIRQNSTDESRCGVYEVVSVDISSDEDDENSNTGAKKHENKELLKKLVSGELELLAEEVYHSTSESSNNEASSEEENSEKMIFQSNDKKEFESEKKSDNHKIKGKLKENENLKEQNLKHKEEIISGKRKHNSKYEGSFKSDDDHPIKKLKSKSLNTNPFSQKENESNINNVIEHTESVSFNHEKNYKNIGLALSRSFRVGWGPGGILITKLPNIVKNTSDGNIVAMEKIVIHRLNLFDEANDLKIKEQHRITLQNQFNNAKIVNESEIKDNVFQKNDKNSIIENIPRVELSPKISFESFIDIISSQKKNIFSRNEIMIWKLCEALFDPILINMSENDELIEKVLDESKNEYFSKMYKKERINQWLEEFLQDEIEQNIITLKKKIKSTKDKVKLKELNNEIIFNLLSGRKLSKACKEIIKQGDYRLATIIAQCGSCFEGSESVSYGKGVPGSGVMDNYTQNLINQQIALWENEVNENNFKSNYINLWKLIGGQIDEVCYGLNSWKRTFALFVWFADGGMDEIKESLAKYDQILESQRKQNIVRKEDLISEPLPSYFEKHLYNEGNNKSPDEENNNLFEYFDMKKKPKHFDIIYHLLKYYVDRSYSKSKILSPQNISSDMLDYRIPWLINSVLTKSILFSEEDRKIQDKLTISLAFQLENLGMWDWACYVCLFITDKNCREIAIKNLLYTYFPVNNHSGSVYQELYPTKTSNIDNNDTDGASEINGTCSNNDDENKNENEKSNSTDFTEDNSKNNLKDNELWSFLVDELKIPKIWIHEARIMKARYNHDVILEAIYLIDAKCWNKVHNLVINEILPEAIINNDTTFALNILKKIDKEKVKDWKNGGELFLNYLEIIKHSSDKIFNIVNTKELLEKLNNNQKSIQKQLNIMKKTSTTYDILLKRKICLSSMCKELIKYIADHETNKENNNELIFSFNIPENQRLYNVKKISNEWFDNVIAL